MPLLHAGTPRYAGVAPTTSVSCTHVHRKNRRSIGSASGGSAIDANVVRATVHFAGCARDVSRAIDNNARLIDELSQRFADYSVTVFEDSSRDDTRPSLLRWAAANPRVQLLLAEGVASAGSRTMRLALCRNTLLASALALSTHRITHSDNQTASHIMVNLDLDCPHSNVLRPDSLSFAVASMLPASLRTTSRYSVLSANSQPYYYDLWALRSNNLLVDYDCLVGECSCAVGDCMGCKSGKAEVAARGNCFEYEVVIHPSGPIVPVEVGYNGLVLYDLNEIRTAAPHCTFDGRSHVEIVPFQQCLGAAGLRVGIMPSLVQGCGAEHFHRETTKTKRVHIDANGTARYRPHALASNRAHQHVFPAAENVSAPKLGLQSLKIQQPSSDLDGASPEALLASTTAASRHHLALRSPLGRELRHDVASKASKAKGGSEKQDIYSRTMQATDNLKLKAHEGHKDHALNMRRDSATWRRGGSWGIQTEIRRRHGESLSAWRKRRASVLPPIPVESTPANPSDGGKLISLRGKLISLRSPPPPIAASSDGWRGVHPAIRTEIRRRHAIAAANGRLRNSKPVRGDVTDASPLPPPKAGSSRSEAKGADKKPKVINKKSNEGSSPTEPAPVDSHSDSSSSDSDVNMMAPWLGKSKGRVSHLGSDARRHRKQLLAIVAGSNRGGLPTWHALHANLLTPNRADLMLVIPVVFAQWLRDAGDDYGQKAHRLLLKSANHVVEVPEYPSFNAHIDAMEAAGPKPPKPGDIENRWFSRIAKERCLYGGPMGGVTGVRCSGDRLGNRLMFVASAAIGGIYRWHAKQAIMQRKLIDKYDWFAYLRVDTYVLCTQLVPSAPTNHKVAWIPSGTTDERIQAQHKPHSLGMGLDFDGIYDRFIIASPSAILDALTTIER